MWVKRNILNKKWIAGKDWIQYAGTYFEDDEFIAGIECFLDGWLALGESGIRFEREFKSKLGKNYGALTNSGSSANLLMISALKSKKLFNLKTLHIGGFQLFTVYFMFVPKYS